MYLTALSNMPIWLTKTLSIKEPMSAARAKGSQAATLFLRTVWLLEHGDCHVLNPRSTTQSNKQPFDGKSGLLAEKNNLLEKVGFCVKN